MGIRGIKKYIRILVWGIVVSWINNTRYKTEVTLYLLDILLSGLAYAFLGKSVAYQVGISQYGTENPIAFIVSGLIITHLVNTAYQRTSMSARGIYGIMKSPLPLWLGLVQNVVMGYLWSFFALIINIIILYSFGITFNINILSAIILLPLSLLIMFCLGVLSAGCNLIVKKGDPIRFLTTALTYYFSGRIFPVQVLPKPLQKMAWILPQTWIYYLWRRVLFSNVSLHQIRYDVMILFLMNIILAIISYLIFSYGINKIREEGLIL